MGVDGPKLPPAWQGDFGPAASLRLRDSGPGALPPSAPECRHCKGRGRGWGCRGQVLVRIWSAWAGEVVTSSALGDARKEKDSAGGRARHPPPAAPAPSWSQRSPDLSLAPASQLAPPEAFFLTRAHELLTRAHPHVYMHTRASQRPAHTASVHTLSFPPQSLIRAHLSWDTHSLIHSTHTCVHVCSAPTHTPQNPSRSIWGPHGPAQERQVPLSRSPPEPGAGGVALSSSPSPSACPSPLLPPTES